MEFLYIKGRRKCAVHNKFPNINSSPLTKVITPQAFPYQYFSISPRINSRKKEQGKDSLTGFEVMTFYVAILNGMPKSQRRRQAPGEHFITSIFEYDATFEFNSCRRRN